MKLKSKTKDLLAAVKFIAPITTKQSTLPALNHILLKAENDTLEVSGSDLSIWGRFSCPITAESSGSLGVPAALLVSFLSAASHEEVTAETKGAKLHLACGSAKAVLSTLNESDFPQIPEPPTGPIVIGSEKQLRDDFLRTRFAMSKDVSRLSLNGAHVLIRDGNLTIECTSGSVISRVVRNSTEGACDMVIPSNYVHMLISSLDESSESPVTMRHNERAVMFTTDSWSIIGSLIDTRFPNVNQAIPKEWKHTVSLPRESLIAAIARVRPFTSERFFPIAMQFEPMLLTLTNIGGEHFGEDSMAIKGGPSMSVGVNPENLLNTLKAMTDDAVELKMNDPLSPIGFFEPDFTAILALCTIQTKNTL